MTISSVAVICFLALAGALAEPISEDDYKQSRALIDSVKLDSTSSKEAFEGLDVDGKQGDGKIDNKDLQLLYWHGESTFAINKFIRWLDNENGGNGDSAVSQSELTTFMGRKASILATVECKFVKSTSLREQCFADQLLTYIYLVLDKDDVDKFYKEFDKNDNKVIDQDEVKSTLQNIHGDFKDDELETFMEELGGDDKKITEEEFKYYVTQEDISDDFRECRKGNPDGTGNHNYDTDCLVRELLEYVQHDLTELDTALIFRKLDKDKNGHIEAKDLDDSIENVDNALAGKILKKMDHDKSGKVDYAEFRTYIRSPTIRLQIERKCTEPIEKNADEIDCAVNEFGKIAKELHDPIWLVVPDLDMLFTFEKIDTSNNGLIEDNDLNNWEPALKEKFKKEVDGFDKGTAIDLEEFNEYVDIPHMVYGMGDCMLKKKDASRVQCYIDELKDIIKDFLEKEQIEAWWRYYDKNSDGYITLAEINKDELFTDKGTEAPYFLEELGMGDNTVSRFEFTWYVKQQELADLYKSEDKSNTGKLHGVLVNYINDYMTELDIEDSFKALDTNHNHELEIGDFKGNQAWPSVFQNIDRTGTDRDNTANFVEFWMWLQEDNMKRKKSLEGKCTKKHKLQKEEVECYKTTILAGGL